MDFFVKIMSMSITKIYTENKDVWFELCKLRTIKSNNMIIQFDEIYDKNGRKINNDYITIYISLMSMAVVSNVEIIMSTNDFEYGGVYFESK